MKTQFIFVGRRMIDGKLIPAFLTPEQIQYGDTDKFTFFKTLKFSGTPGSILEFEKTETGQYLIDTRIVGHYDNPEIVAQWQAKAKSDYTWDAMEKAAEKNAKLLDDTLAKLTTIIDSASPLDRQKLRLYVVSRLMK